MLPFKEGKRIVEAWRADHAICGNCAEYEACPECGMMGYCHEWMEFTDPSVTVAESECDAWEPASDIAQQMTEELESMFDSAEAHWDESRGRYISDAEIDIRQEAVEWNGK